MRNNHKTLKNTNIKNILPTTFMARKAENCDYSQSAPNSMQSQSSNKFFKS